MSEKHSGGINHELITDYDKKRKEYRRREAAIPQEIIEASIEDTLIRAAITRYLQEGNYVLFLEQLVVAQHQGNKAMKQLLIESYGLRLGPRVVRLEREAP